MGAAAVKLLVYYNPRRETAAEHQRRIVAEVAEQCQAYDIPFMLEPLAYPTKDGDTKRLFGKSRTWSWKRPST